MSKKCDSIIYMWKWRNLSPKTRHFVKKVATILAIIGFAVGGIFVIWISGLQIPDFSALTERKVSQSTKIWDRTGEILLYDIHKDVKRKLVPFSEISRNVKNAIVAIEDKNFYNHHGIELEAIFRAVLVNLGSVSKQQGGSTITQQVVKNTILTKEKSIARKIKEIILSLKMETVLTKEQILELYLNEIPWGGNLYGVQEATNKFFDKDAKDVTLAEAAYLAAIPKAPTYYSPYGKNREKLEERKNLVLDKMVENGFIEKAEGDAAKKERVEFLPQQTEGIKAPHFVEFIRAYLEDKYGQDEVETGGMNIFTTLDYNLQQKAETIAKEYGATNETAFLAKNNGIVGIDPKTGQILVMVGSRDYFDMANDGNFNVTTAHRQPGSSFKPIVYATAFKKGYTPETVLFDLQTEFQTTCDIEGKPISTETDPQDCYMPENYDEKFVGPISLREALAQSRNIPSIKTLYLAGISDSIKTAEDLGIMKLADANQYGLTLVLGGGEVSPLDLTSAYSVFANDGVRNAYQSILKIEDSSGNVLEEFKSNPRKVLDENIARQISSILSDNVARTPAYGENSLLRFDTRDVAAKTGTTNDTRDAWTIGYTPNFALGIWVGNNDNSPMEKKVAGQIVVPMWSALMRQILETLPDEKFTHPQSADSSALKPVLAGDWRGGTQYEIDKISGKLATEYTPPELREKRAITQIHSILYWIDKDNPLGEKVKSPESDSQFLYWETPIRKWALERGYVDQTISAIPMAKDDVHLPEYAPKIAITSPIAGRTYNSNERIGITFKNSQTKFPAAQVDVFLNDVYMGTVKNYPFIFYFIPNDFPNIQAKNELKVVVYDTARNKGEATMELDLAI